MELTLAHTAHHSSADSVNLKDTPRILEGSTSKTKTIRANLLVRNENHYHPVKPHQQYSTPVANCVQNTNFFPIVESGDTARSVAWERWREIAPEPIPLMVPDTIDRILAIGSLCGFNSDTESFAGYLQAWEVSA